MGNRVSTVEMGGESYGIHRTMGMGSFGKVHVIVQKSNLGMLAISELRHSVALHRMG